MLDFFLQIDKDLFLFLNGLNHPWLDPVMFHISQKLTWIPLYLLLLYFIVKNYGWKTFIILILVALLITLSDQISVFLKESIQRLRPSRDDNLEGLVHLVKDRRGGLHGFVSSHASNSFALAFFMIHLLRDHFRYIVPVMITWASLNAYSRIYLGVHYPGDVIGGIILGIVCAMIIIAIWRFLQKKTRLTN